MHRTRLGAKLLAVFAGTAMVFGAAMVLFVRITLQRQLVHVLEHRGVSLARACAEKSVDLVLTARYLDLRMNFADELRGEEDLKYLFVLNERGQVLIHTFDDGFPADLRTAHPLETGTQYDIAHLVTEQGRIMDIAVPLLEGRAGNLHVGFSESAIDTTARHISRQVVLIIAGGVLAGSVAILLFTQTVTRRLFALEEAVAAMGRGDLARKAAVEPYDEVGRLGMAFNDMAERRKQAEDDREKLIEDLRLALDNVKTLRGLIPICASCKRIRDDSGYWGQIEAYIARHTDADFSHGICPECAEKLYPGRQGGKSRKKP